MLFSDAVTLIAVAGSTRNALGDLIPSEIKREVLASRKSIRQSEFYQAQAVGLKPEITLVIWACEYQGEHELLYNGKRYSIIRTYETDEMLELTCSGLVNTNATA